MADGSVKLVLRGSLLPLGRPMVDVGDVERL